MKVLGAIPVKQFFYNDLAELTMPFNLLLQPENDEVEVPSDPRFQMAKHMSAFVKRASQVYHSPGRPGICTNGSLQPLMDTFRTACLNRCRVRRTLCHTAIDWDNLQIEVCPWIHPDFWIFDHMQTLTDPLQAEDLDAQLRTLNLEPPLTLRGGEPTYSYPISSWAYHQKLVQLRLIIQLGFELSIYAPEELPGMYWYLSHLCSTHLAHIDRIRTFTVAASRRSISPTSILGKKANSVAERKRAFEKTLTLLDRHTATIIAIDAFALALHALYVLLARHNVLPRASSKDAYSSPRLRYELRMKPFIPISLPEMVSFEDYEREAALEGDSDSVVLDRASRAMTEARKAWESVLANGPFLPVGEDYSSADVNIGPAKAVQDEWQRDVKDSLRACIGTSLAIGAVKKAISGKRTALDSLNLSVELPEVGSKARWHDWWVVPKISEKSTGTKS